MLNINDISYNSRIDTLETREPKSNRESTENMDIKGIKCYYNQYMHLITKYNPNNFDYQYSKEYKLSKTIDSLNKMYQVLTVIDTNNVDIKRIDIATDISANFDDIGKFLDLVHKCIRSNEKNGKAWHNVDEKDLKITNYLFKDKNRLEIEFYNKFKESNGKSNYPTRLELRFLRIFSKEFKLHINNSIALWKSMPNNLEDVEQEIINILKSKWLEEKQLNVGLKFASFVYRYNEQIYTINILKELYKTTGLKRIFASWLQDYRKKYNIELFTQTHLKDFSKNIVKSLKIYTKN